MLFRFMVKSCNYLSMKSKELDLFALACSACVSSQVGPSSVREYVSINSNQFYLFTMIKIFNKKSNNKGGFLN